MDEQRVPTNNKSKKVVRILLIITGIFGLLLIAFAIYFYAIGDSSQDTEEPTSTTTCGCYFIDPNVISECGDPRRAFMFNINTTPSDQTCKATCTTDSLSTNLLNSTTEQDLYQVCQVNTLTDVRCDEMTIEDGDGKIVTGIVTSEDQINIEAHFDQEYSNYQFVINNESIDPDVISSDKQTITKAITDLSNKTTLEIVATAEDENGDQISSTICRRLIEVEQTGEQSVNDMVIETRTDTDEGKKISGIDISVGNITSTADLSVVFTFTQGLSSLTMTDGFTVDTAKGEITMIETDLYSAENFAGSKSFSQLDDLIGTVSITADVRASSLSLGDITKEVTMNSEAEDTTDDDSDTTTDSVLFTVSKTGTPSCVERVSPNNSAEFTLTIKNTSTTTQGVTSIKDKLPLGFEYSTGSTEINGVSVSDSEYITVTDVGDTEELVWAKDTAWSLSSNQTLTISFSAIAGTSALTGTNTNEVVVTPENVPDDPDAMSASFDITVAQDCDNPDASTSDDTDTTPTTGIFDTSAGRVVLGIMVITLGWIVYNRPFGKKVSEKILNSDAYQNAEMTTWKIFNPKRYFEEKIVRGKKRK